MQEERKKILQYALNYDIKDVHTYAGYKGDLMVKIITKDEKVVTAIKEYALSLKIKEVVVKPNVDYELYCVTAEEAV